MLLLNKDIELTVDFDGNFTREALRHLENAKLVYIEAGSVYFYSQKHDAYIYSSSIHINTVDEVVMEVLERILEHENKEKVF
ncbi:hypothetical protein [Billgrantia endophytica]|uniref:Uncharacterized protein n=1 Tax=Billgrantia endophytica TaxID=2033802 RepID=A0A2N7TUF8_9GAMM|nr:hypothetical protein [Halomonas endophytica]PMR71817.1 hypothetical protein C1H69_23060 [Halomonas endophytica]